MTQSKNSNSTVARLKNSKFLKANKWPHVLLYLIPFIILGAFAVMAANDDCAARETTGLSLNQWLIVYTAVMIVGIIASTFSWVIGFGLYWFNIAWLILGIILLVRTDNDLCSKRVSIPSIFAVVLAFLYVGPHIGFGGSLFLTTIVR